MRICPFKASNQNAPRLASAGIVLALASAVHAQTFTVLHSFSGGNGDGAYPFGSVIESGSTLYGMTSFGGPLNGGVIFTLDTATKEENVLHLFNGGDGFYPYGSLIQSGSMLYGMTAEGGGSIYGNIFSCNMADGSTTSIYSFGGQPDGTGPEGALVQSGPILYSMTQNGGLTNHGTIFGFNTATKSESLLYSFGGQPNDGSTPYNSLVQSGSTLYGMTKAGGTSNMGAIVALNTTTNLERLVYSFGSRPNDGVVPFGTLSVSGAILYGATGGGGTSIGSFGTIFAYDTITGSELTLHSFTGFDGNGPESLILSGSTLYGMTVGSTPQGGDGEIFSYQLNTGAFNILHNFSGADGANGFGNLLMDGSTLYGMTEYGGDYNKGVVFAMTVPEPASVSLLGVSAMIVLSRRRSK